MSQCEYDMAFFPPYEGAVSQDDLSKKLDFFLWPSHPTFTPITRNFIRPCERRRSLPEISSQTRTPEELYLAY